MAFDKIEKRKVFPAITLDRADDAVPLAEALLQGGLDVMEITLRTEAAACVQLPIPDGCPGAPVTTG